MNDKEKSAFFATKFNIQYSSQGGWDGQFLGYAVKFNGEWLEDMVSTTNLYHKSCFPIVWKIINWRTKQ